MTTLTQIIPAPPLAVSQVVGGTVKPLVEREASLVEVPTTPSGGLSGAEVDRRILAKLAEDNARDDAVYRALSDQPIDFTQIPPAP